MKFSPIAIAALTIVSATAPKSRKSAKKVGNNSHGVSVPFFDDDDDDDDVNCRLGNLTITSNLGINCTILNTTLPFLPPPTGTID